MLGEFMVFRLVEESSYGVTPASALQEMNVTDIIPARDFDYGVPAILDGTRRTRKRRALREGTAWRIPTLAQYENDLLPLEGVFQATRGAAVSITETDISGVGATGVISTAAGSFAGVLDGDAVYIDGAGFTGNTAGWFFPVTSAGASSFTVPAAQLADFSAGGTVNIRTRRLRDGTTAKSYSAEWEATSLTNQFQNATGLVFPQATYRWSEGGFVEVEFTSIGKSPSYASATIGTGAPTAAPTSDFLTAVDADFGSIWIADASTGNGIGAASTLVVTDLAITYANVTQVSRGLGSAGPSAIDVGKLTGSQVTATIRFDDTARTAVANLIASETTMALGWEITYLGGAKQHFFFPAVTVEGEVSVGGAGSIVTLPVTFTSHDPSVDSTSAYTGAGFGFQHQIAWVPTS